MWYTVMYNDGSRKRGASYNVESQELALEMFASEYEAEPIEVKNIEDRRERYKLANDYRMSLTLYKGDSEIVDWLETKPNKKATIREALWFMYENEAVSDLIPTLIVSYLKNNEVDNETGAKLVTAYLNSGETDDYEFVRDCAIKFGL